MNATIVPAQPDLRQEVPRLRSVDITGPAGRLEALVNEGVPDAPYAALVCHPHPKGGGNLHNKVVYHAMKAFNDPQWGLEWPVLRFNFRGIGLSQGTYDGKAEAGDVLAALAWLEDEYSRPIIAVGFSFGAAMTIAACCDRQKSPANLRALVALGLPTQNGAKVYRYPSLHDCSLPKLFLSGDSDQFAPAQQLAQVASSAGEPKQLVLLPGADHFFTGHLAAMQMSLAGWLKEQLS
jgi:uncharacterized protein